MFKSLFKGIIALSLKLRVLKHCAVQLRFEIYFSFCLLLKGIFAYLNYRVPRTRKEILETLVKGLQRLEYRGYDSAGETHSCTELTLTQKYSHKDT